MNPIVYFDTSALAKWYISESGSAEAEKYIRQHGPVFISDLTIVEMRCLLARRRRDGSLTGDIDARVW
ncbi:MAG: PIN domain-containing protein, partial [Desulfobacteraceae bacterium]